MTYATAFPDFPAADWPALPEGFVDSSYRNDVCPSMLHEGLGLQVFVDYADPAQREIPESKRFVLLCDDDGDGDIDGHVMESDDWAEVLAAIAQHQRVEG